VSARLWLWVVTIHVIAAVVWIGGMFFVALAAPTLRQLTDDATRAAIFEGLGRMFRKVGWACIVVLVATGIYQLRVRGWWGWDVWGSRDFWRHPPGATLAWKLLVVTGLIGVQAVHDFWAGPRAGRARPGSAEARRLRVRAAWLARIGAALALGVLYLAVRLVRGG